MWYFATLRYNVIRDRCSATEALLLFQFTAKSAMANAIQTC